MAFVFLSSETIWGFVDQLIELL